MNRYSLDIFKNPVMHNKGLFCLYKDHANEISDYEQEINWHEEKQAELEKKLKDKEFQYEHALMVDNDAQNETRELILINRFLFVYSAAITGIAFIFS